MDIKVLYDMSYGVYIAATRVDGKNVGCVANTAFQVTAEPVRVGVSISKENFTEDAIRKSGYFTLSIASEDTSMETIGKFGFYSARDIDKFENTDFITVGDGYPVVNDNMCSWILCKVEQEIDCDTHTIFIGKMEEGEKLSSLSPMTYAYYHKVKGGTTAKNAPTYIEEEKTQEVQFVCPLCGYVFPGTEEEFNALPEDWECPLCKAKKSVFERREK